MGVCRLVGWLSLVCALVAALVEVVRSAVSFDWRPFTVGELWSSVSANSLVGFGSLIENHVHPDLWVDFIVPALNFSVWMWLAGIAAFLLLVCRRKGSSTVSSRPY